MSIDFQLAVFALCLDNLSLASCISSLALCAMLTFLADSLLLLTLLSLRLATHN